MNKEQVYDEKISPLMEQIIAICQEHGIAMIANFDTPTENDPTLGCMTYMPDGDGVFPKSHQLAFIMIYGEAMEEQ